MTTLISPLPIQRFVDSNGNALTGGKLFTYIAGTTTKQQTFTDSTGGTPNTNPVILNSRGEANVWLTSGAAYKFVLSPSTDTDPPTNAIWTVDQIIGGISTIANNTLLGNSSGAIAVPTAQTVGFGLALSGSSLSVVLQNFIAGYTLSNDSGTPNTKLDIAQGSATDSANAVNISLGDWTKSISGSFAAGSGNNGMGVGLTATASTWYHVYAIIVNGNADIYFDTSANATHAPVGTSAFRRIGSILLDGSAHIVPFIQIGNRFLWKTARVDVAADTSLGNGNLSYVLPSTPLGINTYARVRVNVANAIAASYGVGSFAEIGGSLIGRSATLQVTSGSTWFEVDVFMSTTQGLLMISSAASGNTVTIDTVSYVDLRGT